MVKQDNPNDPDLLQNGPEDSSSFWRVSILIIAFLSIIMLGVAWLLDPVSREVSLASIIGLFALLGVYPLTYIAYRSFRAETHRKLLKDDFRLLGLVDELELDDTVENLYRTVYSASQFIIYITLIMAFVLLIILVSSITYISGNANSETNPTSTETATLDIDSTQVTTTPVPNEDATQTVASALTTNQDIILLILFSFIGSYLFSVQELIRRYNTFDLLPQVYSSIFTRMLVATGITFVGAALLQQSTGQNSQVQPLALAVAFVIGTFPDRGLQWLTAQANSVLKSRQSLTSQRPITDIIGISPWHQARLSEMGIDDAQNLATADIRKLLLTTRFDTQEIVNWIDQAILYVKVGLKIERFREAYITTFHELRTTYKTISPNPLYQIGETDNDVHTSDITQLITKLDISDLTNLKRIVDDSNYPNYAHIIEYYSHTASVVRQRATAGTELLLGPDRPFIGDFEAGGAYRFESKGGKSNQSVEDKNARQELELLEKYSAQRPDDAKLLAKLGDVLHNLDRNKGAKLAFDKAIEKDPQYSEAYIRRSKFFLDQRKYQEAIKECTTALNIDASLPMAYNIRGLAQMELGYLDRAIIDLDQALDLAPDLTVAHLNRGIAYNALSHLEDAHEDFKAAHLLGYRKPTLWLGWGKCAIARREYKEAVEKLSQAILLEDELALAYQDRGYAYLQLGREYYTQARNDFDLAIKLDKKMWTAYHNLGLLEAKQQRYSEAIQYYSKALEINEMAHQTRLNLCVAYYYNNDHKEAKEDLENLISRAPSHSSVYQEAQRYLNILPLDPTPSQ